MRSLFWKIFLWFWLAMGLVGLAFIVASATTQSEPLVAYWRVMAGDALAIYAQSAADTYEREGAEGLRHYLDRMEATTHLRAALFSVDRQELSGRPVVDGATALANKAWSSGQTEFAASLGKTLAARRVSSRGGAEFVLVTEVSGGGFGPFNVPARTRVLRLFLVFLTAGLVCYGLARYVVRPVTQLRSATRRLADGDLTARVSGELGARRDEFGELGRDFDQMADRIETLVKSHQGLMRDVSHELRSPLARMQVALELARSHSGPAAGASLDRIALESERLNVLIERLLTLARNESGEVNSIRAVNLSELVQGVCADAEFEAKPDAAVLNCRAEPDCVINGDPDLVRSAIENVVRNAMRYSPAGSGVEVELAGIGQATDRRYRVRVRDHGPGVPEDRLTDIFSPFVRVDADRGRSTGGIGLGLSI
ncbi:MAG: ATP-binding protein, partial [Pyrinomonadaceae bacterium]